jgi:hypothetical protein
VRLATAAKAAGFAVAGLVIAGQVQGPQTSATDARSVASSAPLTVPHGVSPSAASQLAAAPATAPAAGGTTPSSTAPAASDPTCSATALQPISRSFQAAAGVALVTAVVQNVTGSTCALGGQGLMTLTTEVLGTSAAVAAPDAVSVPGGGETSLSFVLNDLVGASDASTCPTQVLPSALSSLVASVMATLGMNSSCPPPPDASGGSAPPPPGAPGLPSIPSLLQLLGLPGASPAPSQTLAAAPAPARYPTGTNGYDISWPQCGGAYPPPSAVAIVGVNDGRAFTTNPCVGSEAAWAGGNLDAYMSLNSPERVDSSDSTGPAGACAPSANACIAYNYGYNAAKGALAVASSKSLVPRMWWIDVETVGACGSSFPTEGSSYWSCNQSLNSRTIQGALDAARGAGAQIGIYSTSYQWGVITGGYAPSGGSAPNWIPGDEASPPSSWCSGSHDFAGGSPWLLQIYPTQTYDRDQAC